jgi:GGDEF domain-containing protein
MLTGSPFARPARPVADAPLHALSDVDELAKGWLLVLLAQAPLSAAASVPAADLAREAPALCGAMAAALASEAELDRLRPAGDLSTLAARAGALAGAVDPAGAAAAVSALRGVLWAAVLDGLVRPEPEHVAALSSRLALVADVVAMAALAPPEPFPVRGTAAPEHDEAARPHGAPSDDEAPPAPRLTSVPDLGAAPGESILGDDVPLMVEDLGDESDAVPDAMPGPGSGEPFAAAPPAVPADVFPSVSAAHAEDRDEPWATAVIRRLGRLVSEGVSCSVLAVDVDDAERLLEADVHGEARALLDRIERAIRDELRPGDAAVRERVGRVWVVAQAGGIEGARSLGRRLADAVEGAGRLHGAPLRASIGIAACPDDGGDPTSLVAHADEGVFAARAAGVTIA